MQSIDMARDEQEFWDQAAELNAPRAVWSEDDWDTGVLECLAAVLADLPEGRILDLGCGIGRLAVPLADSGRRIIGVDCSAQMLERAALHPHVEYILNDGRNLPDLGMVDGAYSVLLFQHIPDDAVKSYLQQVSGWLRSGGVFVFQFVEGEEHEPYSWHRSFADVKEWLARADLNVADVHKNLVREGWTWVSACKP